MNRDFGILEFNGFLHERIMASADDSVGGCCRGKSKDWSRIECPLPPGYCEAGCGRGVFPLGMNRHQNGNLGDGFTDGFCCNGSAGDWKRVGKGKRRRLVLHFDVRNTILVADSVTKVNMEQALNTFLTGVTWGKVKDGKWTWLSEVPSLGPPCPGAITYYKYLEGKLARTPEDRIHLRQATGNFTSEDLGKSFRPYFEKHLELLKWNDGRTPDKQLTMVGPGSCSYHYLLPSFIHLINKLHDDGRDFAVVLRTYGMDAHNVLSCIQHILDGNHPQFPRRLPIKVNRTPGQIRRLEGDKMEFEVPCCSEDPLMPQEQKEQTVKICKSELEFYQMLNSFSGIIGFVDDFGHWQQNNYHHGAGKPLWIDPNDDRVQHIFFDDNIRVLADDSIVDVRLFKTDERHFESVANSEQMVEFEDACLVQADLLQIISDLEYFCEKVKFCEENYDRLLNCFSS